MNSLFQWVWSQALHFIKCVICASFPHLYNADINSYLHRLHKGFNELIYSKQLAWYLAILGSMEVFYLNRWPSWLSLKLTASHLGELLSTLPLPFCIRFALHKWISHSTSTCVVRSANFIWIVNQSHFLGWEHEPLIQRILCCWTKILWSLISEAAGQVLLGG